MARNGIEAAGDSSDDSRRQQRACGQSACWPSAAPAGPAPPAVEFSLTDEEYTELGDAAARAGLARGAYAAEVALSVSRGMASPVDSGLREALGEFVRAAGLVRRIGVNLNQAVAKLNATGQRSGDLLPYAAECLRRVERLDAAAEEVCKRLRP